MTKYFGFSSFRTGKQAASSALHGRDVFVRVATGGGKSLSMFLVPLTYSNEAVWGHYKSSKLLDGRTSKPLQLLSTTSAPKAPALIDHPSREKRENRAGRYL